MTRSVSMVEATLEPTTITKNSASCLEVFEDYILDPFGESNSKRIPLLYEVVNDIPLPFTLDKNGTINGLFDCFNCGKKEHRVRDCPERKNQNCINLNRDWMQQYGLSNKRGGNKRRRNKGRYFDALAEKEADQQEAGDDGGAEKENSEENVVEEKSLLKIFDTLEDMPEAQNLKTTKSITELQENEAKNLMERRQRYSRNNNQNNWGQRGGGRPPPSSYNNYQGRSNYRGRGRGSHHRNHDNNYHHGGGHHQGHGGGYHRNNNNHQQQGYRNYNNNRNHNYGGERNYDRGGYANEHDNRHNQREQNPLDYGVDYPSQSSADGGGHRRGYNNNNNNSRKRNHSGNHGGGYQDKKRNKLYHGHRRNRY